MSKFHRDTIDQLNSNIFYIIFLFNFYFVGNCSQVYIAMIF